MTSSHKKVVAVLGASGNVGRITVAHLLKNGYKVIAYGRSTPQFIDGNVECKSIDYHRQSDIDSVYNHADVVLIMVGFEYSLKVWKREWPLLMSKVYKNIEDHEDEHTIFFDNVYGYGLVDGPMTEDTPLNPVSKKGAVRAEINKNLNNFITRGLPVTVTKSADFYGPGVSSSVMGPRFHEMLNKGIFEWLGDPKAYHTFTYLPDIPPFVLTVIEKKLYGNYHIPSFDGSMSGHSIKKILEEHLGTELTTRSISGFSLWALALVMKPLRELKEMMYQYTNYYKFDSTKARSASKDTQVTDMKDGIIAQYKSYR